MQVVMKNPRTGQLRDVKIGWSWTLFLFSNFFGLPLFLRKLTMWGCVFLVLTVISVGLGFVFPRGAGLVAASLVNVVEFGLSIYLAIEGNELTAKNYLELGWNFVEPEMVEFEVLKFAKFKWGINDAQ